jgi:hypothetical protein
VRTHSFSKFVCRPPLFLFSSRASIAFEGEGDSDDGGGGDDGDTTL